MDIIGYYHVEENEAHYNHIEFLVCHNSKHNSLRSPLRSGQSLQWFLGAGLLHGCDVFLLILGHEGVQGPALVLLLVELVNDDTNQQVESEEATKNDEGHKEHVSIDACFISWLKILLIKFYCYKITLYWSIFLTPTLSTASSMISIHPLNVAI